MNKWASSSAVYDHVCSELNTVEQLMVLVAESIKYLEQRNLNDSVINAQFVRVSDNKSDRLRALRELRTTAYGKTVVLDGVKGVKIYHIAQANEGFTNILVLNRMAPVSRILVSAEVGDEIEIPAGIFEVVAVAHLDRYTGLELSVNMDNFKIGRAHV